MKIRILILLNLLLLANYSNACSCKISFFYESWDESEEVVHVKILKKELKEDKYNYFHYEVNKTYKGNNVKKNNWVKSATHMCGAHLEIDSYYILYIKDDRYISPCGRTFSKSKEVAESIEELQLTFQKEKEMSKVFKRN